MELYTIKQVAAKLRISVSTVRKYIRDGKITVIKLSARKVYVSHEDLIRFLNERKFNYGAMQRQTEFRP